MCRSASALLKPVAQLLICFGGEHTPGPNQQPISTSHSALADFFQQMSTTNLSVLMLDYDGTLAPFQNDPSLAVPYPGVRELLRQIQDCPRTRLVIISGRQAHEVQRLLDIEGIEIWGCHGLEKLSTDGTRRQAELDPATKESLARVRQSWEECGLSPFMEVKPTGYAVHWRGLDSTKSNEIEERAGKVWNDLGQNSSVRRLDFDGGIEICASALNKGDVVQRIASEVPKPCSMAYLGDDVTDEDAFRALEGKGLAILVREIYRETAATAWLRPPQDLLAFLRDWMKACKENHERS